MDRERISRYSSVVVPTYFKVYESKKSLSSILKLYARRLARWFSCGTLIAECHSINNLQIWSENMASKQDTYSVLEAVCLLNALGARWLHWVNEKAEVDSSQKMCEAHVCWLSVHGCLPPAVCIRLSASGCLQYSGLLLPASSVSVSNCWWCCQSFNVVFSAPSSSAENRKQNQQRWLQQLQLQSLFIIYYTY
jgi:hypothetical protein